MGDAVTTDHISPAGKFLNLNIDHLSFEISEDFPDGKFIAAGTYTRDELIQNTFGEKDLFISILGSHRGELGGSRYLYLLNQENKGYRPVVDLLMESRLQEAVLTGINGELIQSARPIGRGGVALAIAQSFEKNSNLGARIHFSRKPSLDYPKHGANCLNCLQDSPGNQSWMNQIWRNWKKRL